MNATLLVLVPLAGLMVASTAWLLRWAADARTSVRAAVVVFLLTMMVAMVGGALVYYLHPGRSALVEGLWLGATVMSLSVFPLVSAVLRELRSRAERPEAPPEAMARPGLFVSAVIGLVLLNELLMGASFQLAAGGALSTGSSGLWGTLTAVGSVVASPWFLLTMAAEMFLTVFLLRDRVGPLVYRIAVVQSAIMFLSPPAFAWGGWVAGSIYVASALMIGLFVFLLEHLYRHHQVPAALSGYLLRLLGLYGLMMAGLYLWLWTGSALLFGLSVALEMVLFFGAVVRPDRFLGPLARPWQLDPGWVFGVLLAIFVAELFMGALLDLQINGPGFLTLIPNRPVSGDPATAVGSAVFNGFWFFAVVAGSAWFLLMMGVEMGALVVFKIRETRQPELRARLGIMVGAYAVFTVFFSGFWATVPVSGLPELSSLPVAGWGMGIGTGGPVAPALFGVILLSYVAVGAASALFGRRVLCSALCSAPLMYQGTFIDELKTFNRSSTIGRKYLGTRFSAVYSATMALSLVSLAAASIVSYLDSIGRLSFTIAGADPTEFLFSLYFGVLWYVMFVTIPYTGTYNCVTMGWCHWGTFSAAFSRIGFFRLKVRDRTVCQRCTTLDCARSCPVGLVDMVGQLRMKGEFRSSKCCGVGDCVGACPYGNLYVHDVRHWIARRIGRPTSGGSGLELPMIHPQRLPPGASSPQRTDAARP